MGAWGTAIFADDLAADVRGDWRDAVIDGSDATALTRSLVAKYEATVSDPDDSIVFWLSLAAAQQETGRLQDFVRDRALELIAAGGDVSRWSMEDPSLGRQRDGVLAKLQARLQGPQPAPKRLRRPPVLGVPFDIGDAICLEAPTGRRAAAVVVALQPGHPKGVLDPAVELLDWDGNGAFPSRAALGALAVIHTDDETMPRVPPRIRPHVHVVGTARKDQRFGPEIGRVVEKGIARAPAGDLLDGSVHSGEVILSWTSWAGVIRTIESPRFDLERSLSRTAATNSHSGTWLRRLASRRPRRPK